MTTKVVLYKGGSFTHAGSKQVFLKGVPTEVSPVLAEQLKETGRFMDAGAPNPAIAEKAKKAASVQRNIVRLKDSLADDAAKKAARDEKSAKQAADQKEFQGLVDEARGALPEFTTVKEIHTFAKTEGFTLFKTKMADLIDELCYALADQEFKAQRVATEPKPMAQKPSKAPVAAKKKIRV